MSDQISVDKVSDKDLKKLLTGYWVELKMENWKEKDCIVLASVGPEDRKKLWTVIEPILGGTYGARSVHHLIMDKRPLFVVINAKNYDDGRTSVRDQILQKSRDIDLEFLKEPAVLEAILKSKEKIKKWFCL